MQIPKQQGCPLSPHVASNPPTKRQCRWGQSHFASYEMCNSTIPQKKVRVQVTLLLIIFYDKE